MSAITDIAGNATADSYSAPTQYNTWQPRDTKNIDNSFAWTAQENMRNAGQAVAPWYSFLNQLTNNPYQTGAQTAANNAGTAYTNTGNQAVGNSAAMSQAGYGALDAGNQIYNTAFDPQRALYDRTYQQNMDQVNANQAMRGYTQSGYGAGLANDATKNFNLDWQDRQLGRQLQGVQGLTNAQGQAGQDFASAGQLGTSGAQSLAAGGQVPLQTYNAGVDTLGQGLNSYSQGVNSATIPTLGAMLSYMGLGAQQSNQQGNFDQQYWQNQNAYTSANNAQNAAMWGSIGNLGDSAASAAGGGGGNGISWNSARISPSQYY